MHLRRVKVVICVLLGLLLVVPMPAHAQDSDITATAYPVITVLDPVPPASAETVVVHLSATSDGTAPLAQVTVCSRWHFPATTSRPLCGITDVNGETRLMYPLTRGISGQIVTVTLTALVSYDWTDLGAVTFTAP